VHVRVLIVDDHRNTRESMAIELTHFGLEPDVAESAVEAPGERLSLDGGFNVRCCCVAMNVRPQTSRRSGARVRHRSGMFVIGSFFTSDNTCPALLPISAGPWAGPAAAQSIQIKREP
jgi:hypothetical protein